MAGAAETARLIASLELDDKGFSRGADKAIAKTDKLGTSLSKLGTRAGQGVKTAAGNIAKLGAIGVGILGVGVAKGIQSLEQLDTLNRQTAAVIESTGSKAGVTAKQVSDLASSLEDLTTVDDKVIQGGENMLLTFTNIGKDVFPDATKAMVNLGVAMAGGDADAVDLQATAIQLGKALNDPVKGVTALSKVGVSFTQQQKDQIKAMVDAGRTADAQRIILAELATEFGKAGEAAGTGYAADMRRFNDAIEGAEQALAIGFLPVIQKVTEWLNTKLRDPKVLSAIQDLGTKGAGVLDKAFSALQNLPWDSIGNAFKLMGQGAQAAYDLFNKMPDWLKTAVLTGWGLNKLTGGALGDIVSSLATGLIKGVLGINAAVVNINAATVNGGAGGIGGAVGTGASIGSKLASGAAISGMLFIAADQLQRLPTYIQGAQETLNAKTLSEWKKGWDDLWAGSTVLTAFGGIKSALEKAFGLDKIDTTAPTGKVSDSLGHGAVNPQPVVPGPGFTEYMHAQQQQGEAQNSLLSGVQAGIAAGNNLQTAATASFVAKWGQLQAAVTIHGEATRREIAKGLGITVRELIGLRHVARSEIAGQLGISIQEFVKLRRQSKGDDEKLAAKLGISVDELQAIREKARATAANTQAIKNKDFSPTIKTTVNTTFTVSARQIAKETTRYITNAGRQGPAVT